MKQITLTLLCAVMLGCSGGINDQLIINGTSVAVSTGLSVIKDAAQRHMIANLLQGYAPGLRTITNNPTPAQLAALIDQYTPADIKEKYPQAIAFATPLVINAVETAIAHYGTNTATVVKVVNDVATGLEIGSAGNCDMAWFGLDEVLKKPVAEARVGVNEVVDKLSPIFLAVEHRAGGILHGLLTRLNGTTFTVTVKIPPQPYPDETSEIRKGEKV
jgi:hypothetical protein